MESTKLSSKGQVVLPSAIRAAHRWAPGTEFSVVDTGDGVLLKPIKASGPFVRITLADVFGMAKTNGPTQSLAAMDAAVLAEARRRGRR